MIPTATGWIVVNSDIDICGPQSMNPNDAFHPANLCFPLSSPLYLLAVAGKPISPQHHEGCSNPLNCLTESGAVGGNSQVCGRELFFQSVMLAQAQLSFLSVL